MVPTAHAELHDRYVHGRRVQVLARHLAPLFPRHARVLDIGCGDGRLARLLRETRPDLDISGLDTLVRPNACIPVEAFDGRRLSHPDQGVDVALFVDVLHHTEDPLVLLGEARRVARRLVLIKDHLREGWLAGPTLRLMDWCGNAPHGVARPNVYWRRDRWREAFGALGLEVVSWTERLGLYPSPADWVFGRSLHFIAALRPRPA